MERPAHMPLRFPAALEEEEEEWVKETPPEEAASSLELLLSPV